MPVWPHFAVSEADRLIKVGDVAMNPNVAFPMGGGNVVDKSYMATLPDKLLAKWSQFSVFGFPDDDFPAFFILDPTPIVHGIFCTVAIPGTVHLGSYLRQSDGRGAPTERHFNDDHRGGF